MNFLNKKATLTDYQTFIGEVYGFPNSQNFTAHDMMINVIRFSMRGLKGIRKDDRYKIKNNLIIALSWFVSLMNQLHIDIEGKIWERFPFRCSYCASCPCMCKEKKIKKRVKNKVSKEKSPKNVAELQNMYEKIYPAENRTLEQAGIHFAEETGELSEALLAFLGNHKEAEFKKIEDEAADFFSCMMGIFNSMKIDLSEELSKIFHNNCHICHKAPCECRYDRVINFKS